MTLGTALIWKEWRELRLFFIVGLVILAGLPPFLAAANIVGTGAVFSSDVPAGLLLMLGALLALVAGVGATCRDLDTRVQVFWQSRPVTATRWLGTKYGVGLALLLAVCMIPFVPRLLAHTANAGESARVPSIQSVLACHLFCLVLIYSIAFLLACVVRRAAQAGTLCLTAWLIVYFLPAALPPLQWLSVHNVIDETHSRGFGAGYAKFAILMLLGSTAAAALACLAVRRDWRVHMNLRSMCGVLSAIALILFGATAYQFGSNLKCERRIDLQPYQREALNWVADIAMAGWQGVLLLRENSPVEHGVNAKSALCKFDLSQPAAVSSPMVITCPDGPNDVWGCRAQVLWSPEHAEHAYIFLRGRAQNPPLLCTVRLGAGGECRPIHQLDLRPYATLKKGEHYMATSALCRRGIYVYLWNDRRLVTIGLEDPDAPRVMRVTEARDIHDCVQTRSMGGREMLSVRMMPASELSPRDRLDITLRMMAHDLFRPTLGAEGDLLVSAEGRCLKTYRLKGFEDDVACYEQIGQRSDTPFERLVGLFAGPMQVMVRDGLAHVLEFKWSVTVYDVRRPEHPRRVGHYGTGDEAWFVKPLPGGRMLVDTYRWEGERSTLHIVAAPKGL
jgi:hypothetical protein